MRGVLHNISTVLHNICTMHTPGGQRGGEEEGDQGADAGAAVVDPRRLQEEQRHGQHRAPAGPQRRLMRSRRVSRSL